MFHLSYRIDMSSNMRYFLGNQLFVKRSQYIKIENPPHKPGLELARVPRVPGICGIFGQEYLAPANFGNLTT